MTATGPGFVDVKEDAYGHARRLEWIVAHIGPGEKVVEFGCGTGAMITIPLAAAGHSVTGIDIDHESIAFGRELCRSRGVDPERLRTGGVEAIEGGVNVLIAAEVLEHLADEELAGTVADLRDRLGDGGTLLVTVPNGYGWFELESLLWFRLGLGKIVEWLKIDIALRKAKNLLFGRGVDEHLHMTPSSLSAAPHRQSFTLASVRRLLERHGFTVVETTGSVFFSGPFSNLLFSGLGPAMKLNAALGRRFPAAASNFFLVCRRSPAGPAGPAGGSGGHR